MNELAIRNHVVATESQQGSIKPQSQPTAEIYGQLCWLHEFFNKKLFGGQLPSVVFVMLSKKGMYGYFRPLRWENTDASRYDVKRTDEICMNPEYFVTAGLQETVQTIVHEMCHQWQHHFGKVSRGGYHNSQFAEKMESVGLMPSDTGKPGGKKTGQQMMDYIIVDGVLDKAFQRIVNAGFSLSWTPIIRGLQLNTTNPNLGELINGILGAMSPPSVPNKPRSKAKFSCPNCRQNAWAKPTANLMCGDCHETMISPVAVN